MAINRFGVVVGNRDGQVVLWSAANLVEVGPGTATDLNDAGQVVGASPHGTPVLWHR